jgi:hypothetical protein
LTVHRHTDTATLGANFLGLRSNGTHASPAIVADGDDVVRFVGAAFDGTDYALLGEIRYAVDGTPGSNDMPGRIVFLTSPDGSQTPTERMRISNGGLVNIAGLTASEMVITDASKNLVSAAVATYPSLTELAYVKGATSSIQTQLTARLPLAGGTMTGNITLGENTSIALDPAGSADGKYTGITVTGTAGYTQAFGDLVYLAAADSRWEAADADAATTGDRMLAMVVSAGTDGNACTLLLQGIIRADAKFPALTIGSAVYVGEAAGEIQVAIPTGADSVIRRVGYAMTDSEIYFNPSMDSQVSVA